MNDGQHFRLRYRVFRATARWPRRRPAAPSRISPPTRILASMNKNTDGQVHDSTPPAITVNSLLTNGVARPPGDRRSKRDDVIVNGAPDSPRTATWSLAPRHRRLTEGVHDVEPPRPILWATSEPTIHPGAIYRPHCANGGRDAPDHQRELPALSGPEQRLHATIYVSVDTRRS